LVWFASGRARRAHEMDLWKEGDQKEGLIGNFPTAPKMLWRPCQLMLLLHLEKIFQRFLMYFLYLYHIYTLCPEEVGQLSHDVNQIASF
jgi:hypothetical protein